MRVLKRMGKKLKSNRGFTLVELLAALAIVVMMSLMMSVGVSVGASVQRESTFVAESDLLASTVNTALGDVLRYAKVRVVEPAAPGGEEAASYEQLEAMKTLLKNEDGDQCLIDTDGYGIAGGAVVLDSYGGDATKKRLAISQYVTKTVSDDPSNPSTTTEEKVYYLVSHGIYTNLEIQNSGDHKFELTYIEDGAKKYFHIHYWIAEKRAANPLTKEVEAYFRVANE